MSGADNIQQLFVKKLSSTRLMPNVHSNNPFSRLIEEDDIRVYQYDRILYDKVKEAETSKNVAQLKSIEHPHLKKAATWLLRSSMVMAGKTIFGFSSAGRIMIVIGF